MHFPVSSFCKRADVQVYGRIRNHEKEVIIFTQFDNFGSVFIPKSHLQIWLFPSLRVRGAWLATVSCWPNILEETHLIECRL